MTELVVAGLNKAFGAQPILCDVDLSAESGSLLAVLGPSGSGKTTLLRLICGFERVDSGAIRIGGALVSGARSHLAPERRHVGYVAQDGALFPHLSVADNISFGLPRRGRRDLRRVEELLELVGLPRRYSARPPQELSGGEQQRVSLARALAPKPQLVLLDEPFSSLDAGLRVETRQAVAAALRQSGATAVLVTHDQAEALSLGSKAAVLLKGRLVQVDRPDVLYRRPVSAAVARFVGEAILAPGEASKGAVTCGLGLLRLAAAMPEGKVDVLIRPEQIRLAPLANGPTANVVDVAYYGHESLARLAMRQADGSELTIMARVPGSTPLKVGETIGISVEGEVVTFPQSATD
jgi:iron(III) transport system ATP-binding protein